MEGQIMGQVARVCIVHLWSRCYSPVRVMAIANVNKQIDNWQDTNYKLTIIIIIDGIRIAICETIKTSRRRRQATSQQNDNHTIMATINLANCDRRLTETERAVSLGDLFIRAKL